MKGTTAPDGCRENIHVWPTTPKSTNTNICPQPGDLCLCGAVKWKVKRERPPGRTAARMTALLYALDEFPGSTIVELSERLEWNHETTRYYLWHAQRDEDVYKKHTAPGKRGRLRWRYYLKPTIALRPKDDD